MNIVLLLLLLLYFIYRLQQHNKRCIHKFTKHVQLYEEQQMSLQNNWLGSSFMASINIQSPKKSALLVI